MEPPKPKSAFDDLDQGIRSWLQSDAVFKIILELNEKYKMFGPELGVIPAIIVAFAIGKIKPEDLAQKLSEKLAFLPDDKIGKIAEELKRRVFKPIASGFKKYGIDIEKISVA